jgi:N-acetylglutamate synthase
VDAETWLTRVGERVVVRRTLPEGGLGDVVGDLEKVDTHLHVRTRRGPVAVPLSAVTAGKVVPPRPSRTGPPHLVTSITDLQRAMAMHWRAEETEPHGGWLLRASGGFTNRANSVLPLGDPPDDAATSLAFAARWYAARGLAATASVAGPEPGGVPTDAGPADALRAACGQAGWQVVAGGSALVLTAPLARLRGAPAVPAGLTLDTTDEPDEQWLAGYRYRGQPLSPHASRLLLSAPRQAFFSVRDAGTTVGVARGSLGGGWAGLTAVEVAASHRRRGIGAALLTAVAEWAATQSVPSIYLQVGDANGTALRLYRAAGFDLHHRYDYWRPASGG